MDSGKRSRNFTLLWAFLLPFLLFLGILARSRILPFGGSTLLYMDLDSQYIEFMAEYRRILLGQGSFFYSWNAGLGMNFWALTAYYLTSPFNLLLVLFPENALPLAISVITALKLACAGLAFAYFLKKQGAAAVLFSSCYALSAWALGYAFNIMWLDALIWLPILCAFAEKLIRGEKYAMTGLTAFFALSFLSQFYTAYMTGIFCGLWFLTRLYAERVPLRKALRDCVRFALCAGIAAGISAFMLLPTYLVLKNNMGLMGQEFPAAGWNFAFPILFTKSFALSFDGIKDCLPHIYCGLPVLIGLSAFFFSREIPAREKAAAGALLVLLLFSFAFAPLDFLWHAMDHPSWFPYRYAFLFCFLACAKGYEGFSRVNRHNLKENSALPALIIPALLLVAAVLFGGGSGLFFILLNGLLLAAYGCMLLFTADKARNTLLLGLCAAELFINGSAIIGPRTQGSTKYSDYLAFHEKYADLAQQVLPREDEFYRLEKTNIRNYNDPLGIGYPGVSHFSSTASVRQSEYLKRLGFNCYATWCTYQGSTAASDMLLDIRYQFADTGKTGSLPAREGIRENPALLPLFYFASEEYSRYDFFSDEVTAPERLDALLRLLDGDDSTAYFTEVPVTILRTENLTKEDRGYLRDDMASPAFLEAKIPLNPEKSTYLYIPGASLNYNVWAEDTHELISANRDYAAFPVCLDEYAGSGSVTIRVETVTGRIRGDILAYELDPERLVELAEKVSAEAPEFSRPSSLRFELRMEPADEDRLVVSSIPFDSGWQVSADGKALQRKAVHESVLGFVLPAGCGQVTVSFRPYGLTAGLILSAAGLLLWIGVCLLEKRKYGQRMK